MTTETRDSRPIAPPPELQARIRASLAAQKPPARLRLGARLSIAFLVTALATAAVATKVRPDLASLPMGALLLIVGVLLALAAAAFLVAASPGRRGLGAPIATLAAVSIGAAPLYACLTAFAPLHPVGAIDAPASFSAMLRGAIPCFAIAIVVGAIALVSLAYALRRAVPAAPITRGAALGATAGAWAGVALQVHCPSFSRMHILLAHALPIVLLALVGAWIAPRVLRP